MMDLYISLMKSLYDSHGLKISSFLMELESQEYGACRFEVNGKKVISRNAKITPKKVGQFVTVWKRSSEGITEPFEESDDFDLLVINVKSKDQHGQFVFPKSILIEKGIISSVKKEGKRGFRVYPPWDRPTSRQAMSSQKWQLNHFLSLKNTQEDVIRTYQQN